MAVRFVEYDEVFLKYSWDWLQDEQIKYLTLTPDFSCEDQRAWFHTLKDRTDYLIWGLMWEDRPIGACGLKHITECSGEYWGYIGEKKYWGQKIGEKMVEFIEKEAGRLGLSEVYLHVLAENVRAVRLYQKSGYEQEESNNSVLYMKKNL